MPVKKFSISLHPRVVAEVARRGDERSTVVNRNLERYFFLLDRGRRELSGVLSDMEMGMVLDVLNGTGFFEPFSIQILEADIADSLEDGYAEKWNVDGPALVEKIKGLDLWHTMALVDAVERWWERVSRGEQPQPGEALKK